MVTELKILIFYLLLLVGKQLMHRVKFYFFILFYRGPGGGRPWPNPTNANSVSICTYVHTNMYICMYISILYFVTFNKDSKNLLWKTLQSAVLIILIIHKRSTYI
jgi:hypothetical protein